jgi:hypothetical protein
MAGRQVLALVIEVRILVPEPRKMASPSRGRPYVLYASLKHEILKKHVIGEAKSYFS